MGRAPLAPWVTGGLLVAATFLWAVLQIDGVRSKERAQLHRFADGLARALAVDAELLSDHSLGARLGEQLQLRPPLRWVELRRGGDLIARTGARRSEDGRELVVELPLGGPPRGGASGGRAPSAPWSWATAGGAPARGDVIVRTGFDAEVNRGARREALLRVVGTLLVAWSAIGALVVAWRRSIRARDLSAALDAERAERERLEELGLAAAGLAHETRNPLGLVRGAAQRLRALPEASPSVRDAAEQILDAADLAAARLTEFLQFARLPPPSITDTDAAELLARIVAVLAPDFDAAGVRLSAEVATLRLRCDRGHLEQVVVNLLLNALQACTRGGTVRLALARAGSTASLVVADDGRGIPAELRETLFRPYVSGRPGGTGLGLAIVRRVADQHGWTIEVRSEPGRGATFTIVGVALAVEQQA